jgi:N-acetylglutamate synthase-like GNAT family acetyltransferase
MSDSDDLSLDFTVRPLNERDRGWVLEMVRGWGGTDYLVSRGRVIYAADLPGLCAVDGKDMPLGVAAYEVSERECQLVILEALTRFTGIGTALVDAVKRAALAAECRRLWLVTTNDNLDALRFYQRRGFELVAVHRDLRETAQRLKPSIPLVGEYGITLRDEIELEMRLE